MKLCIIGCGNMGSSLAIGIVLGEAAAPKDILLFDNSAAKARDTAGQIGARAAKSAQEAARKSELVIIAVKPFAVEGLLSSIRRELQGKLLLSIAAGITSKFIKKRVPASCRVAVAMPNIAMRVGKGMCFYFMGRRANARDAKALQRLLSSAGEAVRVEKEADIKRAYVTSSGIAFFYLAIEGMARAAQKRGMQRGAALRLAARAAEGAGAMLSASGKEPQELVSMVATKKGTTVEGLKVLQKMNVTRAFERAALASIRKAEKMGRKSR